MTLIVYKNRQLAADTRTRHSCAHTRDTTCGHCGEKAVAVKDNRRKLSLARSNEKTPAMFRGEKVLAVSGAGCVPLIDRYKRVLLSGQNLEEVHKSYLSLYGHNTINDDTCTILVIGENSNHIIDVRPSGDLLITQHDQDQFLVLGSGSTAAKWINHLMPWMNADDIVNMAMEDNVGVGGNIHRIDFTKEKLIIEERDPMPPKEMIGAVVAIYDAGYAVMEKKAKAGAQASSK